MSLNGLDHPDIQDAYDAAVAEAGGWFFLKYTSRDSVDLLSRGKGGVHEARAAVAKYTEASPLYGVVIYRRRKVLIKLVPENTSRLLLARTTVHFQDVVEKYSPYEALLDITSSEGLTDTHLAASFPLHTATPSLSSSRLDEITEDGEDPAPSKPSLTTGSPNGSYLASQRYRFPGRMESRLYADRSPTASPVSASSPRPTSPSVSNGKPSMSQFLVRNTSGKPSITSLGSESMASVAGFSASEAFAREVDPSMSTLEPSSTDMSTMADPPSDPSIAAMGTQIAEQEPKRDVTETRPSTGSARQSTVSSVQAAARPSTSAQTSYEEDLFDFLKPKPKLGPRPIATSERTKRPTVAPVSSMPAPYRYSMRKADPVRPPLQGLGAPPTPAPTRALPTPPPIPDAPQYQPRPLSRGSIKSLPSHKSTTMTPDKLRLMKAVELRKKQLRKSNSHAGEFVPPAEDSIPEVPAVPDMSPTKEEVVPSLSPTKPEALRLKEVVEPAEQPSTAESIPLENGVKASYKADSGIEMNYNNNREQQEGKRSVESPVIEEQKSEEAKLDFAVDETVHSKSAERAAEEPASSTIPEDSEPLSQDQNPAEEPPSLAIPEQPEQTPKDDMPDSLLSSPETQRSLPDQASPKIDIPGAFSNPISPASELEKPMLDRGTHREEEDTDVLGDDSQPSVSTEQANSIPTAPQENAPEVPKIVAESEPRPTTPSPQASDRKETAHDDDKSSNDDLDIYEMSPKRKNSELARRRQGFIEPIRVDSDAESLSSDGLMDELQTATVEHATPVMVSAASPIQGYFSRSLRPSGTSSPFEAPTTPAEAKEAPSPSPAPTDVPEEATQVEVAARHLEPPVIPPRSTARPPVAIGELPIELKRNVSTEISKRIQALATTTSRDNSRENSPIYGSSSRPMSPEGNDAPRPARSSFHSRTNSYRSFIRSSTKVIQPPAARTTPTPTPAQQSQPVWTVQRDPVTNRESISVTARIVRPITSDSTETSATVENESTQSPTASSIQRGLSSNPPTPQQTDTNPNSPISKRASTPLSPTLSRTSKDVARAPSQASQHQQTLIPSPTMDDFPPPPQGVLGFDARNKRSSVSIPNDENAAAAAPKEGSRTSRFFKRMSAIGSKRRSGMHQVPEGGALATAIANTSTRPTSKDVEAHALMPAPVVVGHLNIQFPDSLLWKRRIVAIDETGYIKFALPSQAAPSQQLSNSKFLPARRFLLSEFAAPYVPDVDRQELPNSIMLDFLDAGTTLQIACEDPVTLVRVSHVLRTYWRAWARSSGVSTIGP